MPSSYTIIRSKRARLRSEMKFQLRCIPHPGCFDVILALEQCHEAGFLNKFTGACNDKKKAVDQCLKEEFLAQRAVNKVKSKEKRAKLEKIWKDMEEPPAMPK